MSNPAPSSSSLSSNGSTKPCVSFEDLWTSLRQCHQDALQELEAKVSKLKKERCLDAQKLEGFYSRNQQLREQHKTLQDTVGHLEDRLRAGVCDRCAVLEENLNTMQMELEKTRLQNQHLVAVLESEKNSLRDDNLKLSTELENLKALIFEPQLSPSPEQEEGMIPDSPVLPSSVPLASKLKRHKKNCDTKIRYTETPLPHPCSTLLNGLDKELTEPSSKNHKREAVLVPDTCEMDSSQSPHDLNHHLEDLVADTCALELPVGQHEEREVTTAPQSNVCLSTKGKLGLRPHGASRSSSTNDLQSTAGESPSLLSHTRRHSGHAPLPRAKRRKAQSYHEEEDSLQRSRMRSFVGPLHNGTPSEKSTCVFVRPVAWNPTREASEDTKGDVDLPDPGQRKPTVEPMVKPTVRPTVELTVRPTVEPTVEPTVRPTVELTEPSVAPVWSMDPALALSMYDTESSNAAEERHHSQTEVADPDCTFISHSLLQRQGLCNQDNDQEEEEENVPIEGLCQKANDSLDQMFDTTAYGEYDSCDATHFERTQPRHEEAWEEEEEGDNVHKERNPTFAHMAVIRKKAERRKLKGSTCKECDIYYAHLPEEERKKKLSACSRHRFLYVPPSTPENFWEVGFPSTQTCIERGYIKEDQNPPARLRRRHPLTAMFSPKS